jgi:hypothetical protein
MLNSESGAHQGFDQWPADEVQRHTRHDGAREACVARDGLKLRTDVELGRDGTCLDAQCGGQLHCRVIREGVTVALSIDVRGPRVRVERSRCQPRVLAYTCSKCGEAWIKRVNHVSPQG